MNIFNWFRTEYTCRRCLECFYEEDKNKHGKTLCEDNRRCWEYIIIKTKKGYEVQGQYYFSPHYRIIPTPYYDTVKAFKSLKTAKQFKDKLLIDSGNKVVG